MGKTDRKHYKEDEKAMMGLLALSIQWAAGANLCRSATSSAQQWVNFVVCISCVDWYWLCWETVNDNVPTFFFPNPSRCTFLGEKKFIIWWCGDCVSVCVCAWERERIDSLTLNTFFCWFFLFCFLGWSGGGKGLRKHQTGRFFLLLVLHWCPRLWRRCQGQGV